LKTLLNPKLRVVVFLFLINALWMVITWLGFQRPIWLWMTPIALSINFLLLTYDQVLTFTRLQSQPLLGQDPWGVLKLVHELSEKFQIPAPQVFLIAHPSAQVFCYAKTGKRTRLFVTEGALKLLAPRELKAVLTFQMCVMNSSYNVLNYWLGATVDLFYRAGRLLESGFAFVFGWTPKLSAWVVSPWIWLLHHTMMSARDFQRLDREAAARTEAPEDLARALWKMEAYAQTQPWSDSWVFAHMCMVSPLGPRPVLRAFRIQPLPKNRIKGLTGRYPL
jgi:hypothetical protein